MRSGAQSSGTDNGMAAPIDAARRSGPTWRLTRDTAPTAADQDHRASVLALCNGVLGVRGGIEEVDGAGGEAFLSALFDRTPIAYHERFTGFACASDTRVPAAEAAQILIALAGGAGLGQIEAFTQTLDLAAGGTVRRTTWRTEAGQRLIVTAERRVPVEGEAVLAIRLTLASLDYAGPVTLTSVLFGGRKAAAQGDDPRLGAGHGAGLTPERLETLGADAVLVQRTSVTAQTCACAQTHRGLDGLAEALTADRAETVFQAELSPGQSVTLEKFVAYGLATDPDAGPLGRATLDLARRYADQGFDHLAAQEARDLARFWDGAQIDAPRTPELEAALRYSLFQLRQNAPRDGKTGIAAKGLSGQGYEGHCFWDAEVFAAPVLAAAAPDLARSQLMFRAATLDRARLHAREMNHPRGALYPWRTIAGDEASAYFPGGSAQYHINADLAFAVKVYDRSTGDEEFLADHGAEVVLETARIWLQIGAFNPRRGGGFCITGVTGPDEYTALVDNDFYTNRMAKAHLDYALELVERLSASRPETTRALLERLGVDAAELALWRRASEAMVLPVDPILGVHPQDDTFLDKPAWDFESSKDQHPLLLHYHPLTLYRAQVCKQASVVLAHILCGADDLGQKQRDFDYYQAVTVHDSTLSASSHAILAVDIGEMDQAGAYLRETAFVDLDNLHGNTDHGLHLAAAAGGWMALVWGWGGFRPLGEIPHFRPVRSAAVPAYAFRMLWRGRALSVSVDEDGVTYSLLSGAPLTIDHDGAPVDLVLGAPVRAPTPAPRAPGRPMLIRRAPKAAFQGAVFDLDGVLTDTARAHYRAWKRLADEIGVPFDEQANEALKGVDRMGSLDLILARADRAFGRDERLALAERKNGYYVDLIQDFGPGDLYPGAREALESARAEGLKLALASASRNARFLVERMGIAALFDHIVDAGAIMRGKPDPEIYLTAAAALGLTPTACIGLEDAQSGVIGLRAAGLYAVGVGDRVLLKEADAVIDRIGAFAWAPMLRP